MTLRIHDTATRQTVPFEPIDPAHIRMYVCGPTVYDRIHIGNARPAVIFDVLYRLLQRLYPRVTYVRNITDVDDKINARAAERGIAIRDLTEGTAAAYRDDTKALGCLPPDVEPRATEHIAEMQEIISRLIALGHAYAAEGHVLFSVPSWKHYGAFARKDRDEQIAGARVDVAAYKRDPADFVLWKPSQGSDPGWDSPWGYGRPGWHIECSAMSEKHLGKDFDIHGGGLDLIFPHHQNEIAQSCCANPGSTFAKYWMHNGYLLSEGEKMSKSLGNFYTVAELLEKAPGEALRLLLLKTHYRAPLDFTKAKLTEAKTELDRLYGVIADVGDIPKFEEVTEGDMPIVQILKEDLNTPQAIAYLHAKAKQINQAKSSGVPLDDPYLREDLSIFRWAASLLGLLQQDPKSWFQGGADVDAGRIEALIAERLAAKKAKDFARADSIRAELLAEGIALEDKPGGVTEWRKA